MRHTAELEFTREITVDEQVVFLNEIKTAHDLNYTDIVSDIEDSRITVYFTTQDGDRGRIQIVSNDIIISVKLSFTRLIALHDYTANYFTDILVDLIDKYGNSGGGSDEDDDDTEPNPPLSA